MLTSSQQILVLNGDTYCRFELSRLVDARVRNAAAASIWLTKVTDSARFPERVMARSGVMMGDGPGIEARSEWK